MAKIKKLKEKMGKNDIKKKAAKSEEKEEDEGGMDLDDAFGDDEDVEYGKSKPFKKREKGVSEEELDEELHEIEKVNGSSGNEERSVSVDASKPISKLKKGDKVKVDGKEYEVDAHYVLIDHSGTKEMALEVFDAKNDKDYQLRYFDDQAESTLELYELQEIMYVKKPFTKVSW